MDILIPFSWLKKLLDTKATSNDISKYLSLCGPSIEKVSKTPDGDNIFSIEITTNRVDTAGVIGIAREASAILPRFGIKANLKNTVHHLPAGSQGSQFTVHKFVKKVKYLSVLVDQNLCPRFTAVLIKNVTTKDSPKEIKTLLEKVGVRPINNIVDVSNYIMHELGQPVHTFDFDKITGHKMILRESKKGERIKTLDGKEFKLSGGDIVIEDASEKLIDLCGIMGGENSAIDNNTKNVLLFVQTYDKHHIRKTSMELAQRSEAAVLFEKGLDTELVNPAILSSIELIEKISGGKAEKEILDIYKNPYKKKYIKTSLSTQEKIIGIKLDKIDITNYLESLGFEVVWENDNCKVGVPSFRAEDVGIEEDIAEEIARIYGYHNLPNILMAGELPPPRFNKILDIEKSIKNILLNLGAIEILNLSLTDKANVTTNALRLKNTMGAETEYLRTSLKPALVKNIVDNSFEENTIHIFELSNIYIPNKSDLPKEILTLAGVIKNIDYQSQKGIITTLLTQLKIDYQEKIVNSKIEIYSNKVKIGEYYILEKENIFYYEFDVEKLSNAFKLDIKFRDVPKFPPQIEDLTFELPERTYIGNVITEIYSVNKLINKVTLKDIYKNNHTFNIEYLHPDKTLTDKEVEEIRNKIIKQIIAKYTGKLVG